MPDASNKTLLNIEIAQISPYFNPQEARGFGALKISKINLQETYEVQRNVPIIFLTLRLIAQYCQDAIVVRGRKTIQRCQNNITF